MKDIVISRRRIKTEIIVFLACVLAMELLNVYSIIKYDGSWSEAFFSLGFVVVAAVVLYAVLSVLRLIIYGVVRSLKK